MDAVETKPVSTMKTEVHYATSKAGDGMKQIFMVQEVPALTQPPEAQTYGCLESDEEFATAGRKKYNSIEINILYIESQHDALKALADARTPIYMFVKLPDETAATAGKPLTYVFPATIGLGNETISLDGMLTEKLTVFKTDSVEEIKGLPSGA